jgi:hypothetical protein
LSGFQADDVGSIPTIAMTYLLASIPAPLYFLQVLPETAFFITYKTPSKI